MARMDLDRPVEKSSRVTWLVPGLSDDRKASLKTRLKLQETVRLLLRATRLKDTKLLHGRVMRQTAILRGVLDKFTVSYIIKQCTADHHTLGATLREVSCNHVKFPEDYRSEESDYMWDDDLGPQLDVTDEVHAYTGLIVAVFCLDHDLLQEAKVILAKSIEFLRKNNKRTLDGIAAKTYFYYSLVHERLNSLDSIRRELMLWHRDTIIHHNELGQETILNLLLRNFLHYNLYDQAESFRGKAQKSEVWRSGQQLCRYLFYMGKIRAIQLDYTDAKDFLSQASRKAPVVATGFQVIVTKWLTVVRLLLGEIPDHSDFKQPHLEEKLRPYFSLTQAVRIGDLDAFAKVAEGFDGVFRKDGTHNLITRLRHNVIKTGLRRINLAYSRISIADIARKLNLRSGEDTEGILAKAIRDGQIEAVIDHTNKWMISKQTGDVYATSEPQNAYHSRIAFCLDVHNEAVKAMQFEDEDAKKRLETMESNRERALLDEEYAKQVMEDDMEEDEF